MSGGVRPRCRLIGDSSSVSSLRREMTRHDHNPIRRPVAAIAGLAVSLVLAAPGYAAPQNVPIASDLHASPNRFCVNRSNVCPHPGTTLSFRISTRAKVRLDVRPGRFNVWGYTEFDRWFPKGENSLHFTDARLRPGPWRFRIQGRNSVGSGTVAVTTARVVRQR